MRLKIPIFKMYIFTTTNSMDIAKLEFYLKKKLAGTDYSELRKEMRADGMSQEAIDQMIPEIDAAVLEITLAKQGKTIQAKTFVGWGIIIFSALALVTLMLLGLRGGLIIIALLGTMLSGAVMISQQRNTRTRKFDKFKR